jgi:hypothetical protein
VIATVRLRTGSRRLAGSMLAGALTVAAAAGTAHLLRPDAGGAVRADVARAVAAYEAALEPLVEDAGFVVAEGLRPGVADVADGRYPDEVLVRMATGWVDELVAARAALAALPRHPALADVAASLDGALAGYVEVATVLRRAAGASGAHRQALLDRVADLGPAADERYDAARAAIDALRAATHGGRGR